MNKVREHNENIIFRCKTDELNIKDIESVKKLMDIQPEKPVIVNLSGVSKIKNTTLGLLNKIAEQNKLSLCSLEADVFAAINLLNYDKKFNIYPDEESSIVKAPELKNRRFKVV